MKKPNEPIESQPKRMTDVIRSLDAWIKFLVFFVGSLFVVTVFWSNASDDHEYLKETVKPYIEQSKSEAPLKEYQYNQILKALEEIKTELKSQKEKRNEVSN